MRYVYSVDTFGRCYLENKCNSINELIKTIKMLNRNFLDEDTQRYLIITTEEKKTWLIENE